MSEQTPRMTPDEANRAAVSNGRRIMADADRETSALLQEQFEAARYQENGDTQTLDHEIPVHTGTITKELGQSPIDTTLSAHAAHLLLREDGTFTRPQN